MWEEIVANITKGDMPIIPIILVVLLVAGLVVGIVLERNRGRLRLTPEEEYFKSIIQGDITDDARKRLNKYREYMMVGLDGDKQGYCFKNRRGETVYEAYKTGEGDGYEEYTFNNVKKNRSHTNKIGAVMPNVYGAKSFDFDGTDIWQFFRNRGVSHRITKVNDFLTVYSVEMGNKKTAFGKKELTPERRYNLSIRTNEKELGYLFLFFFAVVKTNN